MSALIAHYLEELLENKVHEGRTTGSGSNNFGEQGNAGGTGRSKGGAEAFPREQVSQEGYLHDLSSRTQTQHEEPDE